MKIGYATWLGSTGLKQYVSTNKLNLFKNEEAASWHVCAIDGTMIHETRIFKDDSEELSDFESSFASFSGNAVLAPQNTVVASTPPFAQPTFRTKRNATGDIITVAPGADEEVQFMLASERYVSGGSLVIENAEFGDYVVAEVEDVDGVIPAPYRAALCENWPVVATYIEKEYIEVSTPGSVQTGAITVHKIQTAPLNAKITAGLYLCIHYYSVNSGLNRKLAVNYHLTKKLS
jgi:hypothetical protein